MSDKSSSDDFFIGWQSKQPPSIGKAVKIFVVTCFILGLSLAVVIAFYQKTIGLGVYQWNNIKSFEGILKKSPYPHLLIPRPGASAESAYSAYPLVAPLKFGLSPEWCGDFENEPVTLEGAIIHRGKVAMIEARPESIAPLETAFASLAELDSVDTNPSFLGVHTLTGEIVDSKCYYGAMNPGNLKPHRACAIICIKGGIPPVFVVRGAEQETLYFLLVDENGESVNAVVLDKVAEALTITGEVWSQGDLLILKASPESYKRTF